MQLKRADRTAERDWQHGQEIGYVEYEALSTELGGEPVGDRILSPELWRAGSEATGRGRWQVMAEDDEVAVKIHVSEVAVHL